MKSKGKGKQKMKSKKTKVQNNYSKIYKDNPLHFVKKDNLTAIKIYLNLLNLRLAN